jgi:hypothetical protein
VTAFAYGKNAPHPAETHPRVALGMYLYADVAPEVVDWASKVTAWPMYDNDRFGDCTCAALGHAVQAWTTYGKGNTVTLSIDDVLGLYSAVTGFDPQTGANDRGAVEQDVLGFVQKYGIGGHRIRAFAQVDHKNLNEMKLALQHFGTVYVGFQVPESAQQQFGAGQPWTVVPGSPIEGGHAIDIQKWDADYMYAVTWGKLQPMTTDFWLTYGDEAWVIITDDWLNENGLSPEGLNVTALLGDFDEITGQTPQPAPRPVPTPPNKGCNPFGWARKFFKA